HRPEEDPPDRLRAGPRPARRTPVIATAQLQSRRSPAGAQDLSRRSPTGAQEDPLLVMHAGAHAAVLMAAPAAPVIAFGLWWNANTISHYFIHRPFFRGR